MERFIIAGTQRTGTSLIVSTLASHPDIHCLGEVFLFRKHRGNNISGSYRQYINQQRWPRTLLHYTGRRQLVADYLDELYRAPGVKAMGFKFMLSQARQFPDAVRFVRDNHIKVLHVLRENVLKTLVSRVSAKTRKLYHARENMSVEKIHLPVRKLMYALDSIQDEIESWTKIAAENPYEVISYESFVADRECELRKALKFIGITGGNSLSSKLRKINPDELSNVIENYMEVANCLSGTRYERFLS